MFDSAHLGSQEPGSALGPDRLGVAVVVHLNHVHRRLTVSLARDVVVSANLKMLCGSKIIFKTFYSGKLFQ